MENKKLEICESINFAELDNTTLQKIDGGNNLINDVVTKIYQKITSFFNKFFSSWSKGHYHYHIFSTK